MGSRWGEGPVRRPSTRLSGLWELCVGLLGTPSGRQEGNEQCGSVGLTPFCGSLHVVSVDPACLRGFLISSYLGFGFQITFLFCFLNFSPTCRPSSPVISSGSFLFFVPVVIVPSRSVGWQVSIQHWTKQTAGSGVAVRIRTCYAHNFCWNLFTPLLSEFWVKFVIELIS